MQNDQCHTFVHQHLMFLATATHDFSSRSLWCLKCIKMYHLAWLYLIPILQRLRHPSAPGLQMPEVGTITKHAKGGTQVAASYRLGNS